MSVKIIVDSTADMIPQAASRVKTVPLTIRFGEEEYVSGVDIDAKIFYEKLIESDVLPTTSQPTPFVFTRAFREVAEAGDTAVCITVSSKLSGTYQSATIAAAEFPGQVFVVDSRTVAIGSGILAEQALRLADSGMRAGELAAALLREREKVRVLALVDTLEYLKKGGRISPTVAFAGNLLNIKPVITVDGGEVRLLGKARGSRQGNNLLVQEIGKAGGVDFSKPVMLGYTGLSDAMLQKYIRDSAALWEGRAEELPICIVGSVVGTHVGPGAVAAAFFAAGER